MFALRALQQIDFAGAGHRLGAFGQGTAASVGHVYTPFLHVVFHVQAYAGVVKIMAEVLGNVETNATRTDNGDGFSDRFFGGQYVGVVKDFGVVDAGEVELAGRYAGGDYNLVETR